MQHHLGKTICNCVCVGVDKRRSCPDIEHLGKPYHRDTVAVSGIVGCGIVEFVGHITIVQILQLHGISPYIFSPVIFAVRTSDKKRVFDYLLIQDHNLAGKTSEDIVVCQRIEVSHLKAENMFRTESPVLVVIGSLLDNSLCIHPVQDRIFSVESIVYHLCCSFIRLRVIALPQP